MVQFSPSLEETKVIMVDCLKAIVRSTECFPRIEKELFPEMANLDMYLLSVDWKEDHVQELVKNVVDTFEKNTVGPIEYIRLYDKYSGLLSGEADRDKADFLAMSDAPLKAFKEKMDGYHALSAEISDIRGCAMLNLFEIDAMEMNQEMALHAIGLRNDLIQWQVSSRTFYLKNTNCH